MPLVVSAIASAPPRSASWLRTLAPPLAPTHASSDARRHQHARRSHNDATATFAGQFLAVSRKNVLYKLRNRKHTILEIAWPVYFVVILALTILPSLKSPINSPPGCTGLPDNSSCTELLPKSYQLFGYGGECQSVVLFAPNTSAHAVVMADALALLGENVSDPNTACTLGFASQADLEDAYVGLNSSAPHPNAIDAVRAAVFLPEDLVGPVLSYTIAAPPNPGGRWRSTNYDGTLGEAPSSYGDGLRFELDLADGGSSGSGHNQPNSPWESWLSLQWALDHALGLAVADADAAARFRADPPPLPLLGKLPLAPFDAPYAPGAVGSGLPGAVGGVLSYMLPIYLVWGNTICVAYIANLVVSEREKKLVDGMQVMIPHPYDPRGDDTPPYDPRGDVISCTPSLLTMVSPLPLTQVMGLSPLAGWLGWWAVPSSACSTRSRRR